MKRIKVVKLAVVLLAIFAFIPAVSLKAIPAFARKYQISCQVCHSPAAPVLKAFGDEFAGNGFRMTEYEAPRYFVNTGDDKLSLLREVPLAVRIDGFASYNMDRGKDIGTGFPYIVKLLSGGEITDKLSYYFYFLMSEEGAIVGLEDAFLSYNDLFGSGVNVTLGQFSVSDPLFKSELRPTLEPYKVYGVSPTDGSANMKYDRGIIVDKSFSTGTTVVAEVVTGNGIGQGSEGYFFDRDRHKNVMLRLSQDIGNILSIGMFGYSGKEENTRTNDILIFGPDVTMNFNDRLMINAQYLWRTDSDVLTDPIGETYEEIKMNGGFLEIVFAPKGDMSKWYLTGLLNLVDSEIDDLDYTSATLHAGYLLRRNVRLVTEYTQILSGEGYGKISAGFVSAF